MTHLPRRPVPGTPESVPTVPPPGVLERVGFGTGAAFGCGVALTGVLAATGGTRHTFVDELAFLVLTAGIAAWYGLGAGVVSGAIAWLMLDGFLVDRHGQLRLHGDVDLWRILALMAVAALGAWARRAAGPHIDPPDDGPEDGPEEDDGTGGHPRDRYERAA